MLAEKCWDRDPSARPYIAEILVLFETASRGWVSPTSELIMNLSLDCLTSQNSPTAELAAESADTMSETGFGAFGGSAMAPAREAGQLTPISNEVGGTTVI